MIKDFFKKTMVFPFFLIFAIWAFFSNLIYCNVDNCIGNMTPFLSSRNAPSATLIELKNYVDNKKLELEEYHKLEIIEGHGHLKIDFLLRNDKKFSILVLKAIREGSLVEIDAGKIIGPKVLTLLNHLKNEAVSGKTNLTIKGYFFARTLLEKALNQQTDNIERPLNSAYRWEKSEIRDFNLAVQEMEISKCQQFAKTTIEEECYFLLKIGSGKSSLSYFSSPQ